MFSYQQYLDSNEWKKIKIRKERSVKKRCSICASSEKIDLHHLFYRPALDSVRNSGLRWLCRHCHGIVHSLKKSGELHFPKPTNHHSCFAITKTAVRKQLGLGNRNMFKN